LDFGSSDLVNIMEEGAQTLCQLLEICLVHRRVKLQYRQILIEEQVATNDEHFLAKHGVLHCSSNVKPAGINFLVRHGGIGVYSMNNGLGETGEGVGGLKRGFISNINTLGA
jgi:hypothetical protein